MRILFTADLHLKRRAPRQLIAAVADPWHEVWIDTGDFLPNTKNLRTLHQVVGTQRYRWREVEL